MTTAGCYQRYKTRGFSMEPFLWNGDELLIYVAAGQRYQIGDILLYRSSFQPEPVAHRLIAIEGGGDFLVLRSDSVPNFTERVSSGAVLGRAAAILRHGKIISISSDRWSKRWLNYFMVKVYPAVLDAKHLAVVLLMPVISFVQGLPLYRKIISPLIAGRLHFDSSSSGDQAQLRAWVGGSFAGSLSVCRAEGEDQGWLWISNLSVRIRYRGTGIDSALMEEAQSYAKTKGFRGLRLTRESGDPASALFYQRVGFEDCGTRDGKPLMRKTV
jgi:Acetyltransferase (GNAT) domain